MAGAPDLKATINFLTDAAQMLAAKSPETSAYLMSRRNDLMFEYELPLSDKQRQQVCTSCGHIMLPGKGSQLRIKPEKRPSNRKPRLAGAAGKPSSGPTKVVTCGHCSRLTNVQLPAPPPISRPKAKKVEKAPGVTARSSAAAVSETAPQKTTSSSASSKKRAKSRKAGLQALLDQSGASRGSRPGLGLSLADFMEKK